ncbi:pseudaminic acid cytidylyltransferase [Nostoc ellipsosporum NOK]|nr:pseudaminic acid cytidylyltransferase [Nostoc ellipsosporum NOK]
MKNIAIITARGGSKRIPRKNIRPFAGKPILYYSIKAAQDSGLFSEIMVSTDDEEIAAVAKTYGANVPFLRTANNADDYATTADVLKEVLGQYQSLSQTFDNTCCIYPTAAFVTGQKLREAFEHLINGNYDSVFPVIPFSHSVLRSLKINEGKMEMAFPEYEKTRSQDLPAFYHDSGQFYWLRNEQFIASGNIYTANTGNIIITEMEAQDIDNETDWKLAEIKFKLLHGEA